MLEAKVKVRHGGMHAGRVALLGTTRSDIGYLYLYLVGTGILSWPLPTAWRRCSLFDIAGFPGQYIKLGYWIHPDR